MNKTDQQKNNKYINYWTENGKSSKEINRAMKIAITTTYKDSKGNLRTRTTYRHPKLSDLTFESLPAKSFALTKEQKEERFNNAKYSDKHDKLVSNLYGKINNIFKKQAEKAAHEDKINNIMFNKKVHTLVSKQRIKGEYPNLLIIQRKNSKGLPYDFSINPSRKTLEELRKDGEELNNTFSKTMRDYCGIEIWEKSRYELKGTGVPTNYRYCIFKNKEITKSAA